MKLFYATIIKNEKKKPNRLLQNGFQEFFQHFTVADRNGLLQKGKFWRKFSLNYSTFFFVSQKEIESGNVLKLPRRPIYI